MSNLPRLRKKGRLTRKRLLTIAGFLLVIGLLIIAEEFTFRSRVPAVTSEGHNALWIRHAWVGEPRSEAQYRDLALLLTEMKMSDAYVHTGPLLADGTIDRNKARAIRDFVASMKKLAPEVRLQAWLGQVERRGGGPLDISSAKTRSAIIRTAEWLLDLGFDGIHYDIEPIHSGDRDFIALLETTHLVTRKRGAVLSVAASKPSPVSAMVWIAERVATNPGYWNRDYFLKVAHQVDQVAVMAYDSGIPLPGLYGRDIAWIVEWSVANGVDDLLIGIPTYEKGSLAHIRRVENVGTAISGLQAGVARLNGDDRRKVGAAVYAEWTTSDSEWREFRRRWVTPE